MHSKCSPIQDRSEELKPINSNQGFSGTYKTQRLTIRPVLFLLHIALLMPLVKGHHGLDLVFFIAVFFYTWVQMSGRLVRVRLDMSNYLHFWWRITAVRFFITRNGCRRGHIIVTVGHKCHLSKKIQANSVLTKRSSLSSKVKRGKQIAGTTNYVINAKFGPSLRTHRKGPIYALRAAKK